MLWRACFMGVYGAAIGLIAILWLFAYAEEPPMPMLYGVLGVDAFLTAELRVGGSYTRFIWTRLYYCMASVALLLFIAAAWFYGRSLHHIVYMPDAPNRCYRIESLVRSLMWMLLVAAIVTALTADHWSDFFFVRSELWLHHGWFLRPARPWRAVGAVGMVAAAACCGAPVLRWQSRPGLRRALLHLMSIITAAMVLWVIGSNRWDVEVYWSPWKTVCVLPMIAGLLAAAGVIGVMPASMTPIRLHLRRGQIITTGLCAAAGCCLVMALIWSFAPGYFELIAVGWMQISRRVYWTHPYLCGPFVLVMIGVCTGVIANAAWRRYARARKGFCPRCDYDLRGTLAAGRATCPECGAAIPSSHGEKTQAHGQ